MIPELDIIHHEQKKLQGFKRSKLSFNKTIKEEGSRIQGKHQLKDNYNVDYISPWEDEDFNFSAHNLNYFYLPQGEKSKAQKSQGKKQSEIQKQPNKTNLEPNKAGAMKTLKKVEYSEKEKKSVIETIIRQNRIQTEPNKQISLDTGFGPLRYEKIKIPDSIRSGKPYLQKSIQVSQKKLNRKMKMTQADEFKLIFSKKKRSKTGASIIDMNETTDQFQKLRLRLFNEKRTSLEQQPQKKKIPLDLQHSTLFVNKPVLKMENINKARLDEDLEKIKNHSVVFYDKKKVNPIKDRRIMSKTKEKISLCFHLPISSNINIK